MWAARRACSEREAGPRTDPSVVQMLARRSKYSVHVKVGGVTHWLWRAVDEHGDVLDIFLQEHHDTEAARSFFVCLVETYDVPEVIHTDKLWSYGAALREVPVLHGVEHLQVVFTAHCNNLVEQSH